jgi:hypothetical protein
LRLRALNAVWLETLSALFVGLFSQKLGKEECVRKARLVLKGAVFAGVIL